VTTPPRAAPGRGFQHAQPRLDGRAPREAVREVGRREELLPRARGIQQPAGLDR
jgi:hypothetical protein